MKFYFSNPIWLWALIPVLGWVCWFGLRSSLSLSPWRKALSIALRIIIVLLALFALAGLQLQKPIEGMNTFYLLDRSQSVPFAQQEAARLMVIRQISQKKPNDKVGVVVFGADAAIESSVSPVLGLDKIQSVINANGSDIGAALRLASAAFPEAGQKKMVLFSDGNENLGDALSAVVSARPLGATLDIVPLGSARAHDVAVEKIALPPNLKKGQTFDVKIFLKSDAATRANLRLFKNEQLLGEQQVDLSEGKNLFTFPQELADPGFYQYSVQVDVAGDVVPQNNHASAFANVKGEPRILVISSDPSKDAPLAKALISGKLEVRMGGMELFPKSLAEMNSYDSIFLSNIGAGEASRESWQLLESAVRDFGVGLVCLGGDQSYSAGSYRGTPLEDTLPVSMDLNSKKVLPSGALVLVVHATEFPNGNQWSRDIAFAALNGLGPLDEMGVVLWNGTDQWLFPLQKVGDKKKMGQLISGMMPGDMPSFKNVMKMAYTGLKDSKAHLKHMVVFSDGDPGRPDDSDIQDIVNDKITISTVMIGGHTAPDNMVMMANAGHGQFYDVRSAEVLPQIFIKESAVILKSAIFEEPFIPKLVQASELIQGIAAAEYPELQGYVCVTPKGRAEIPLVSDKGDPILAHWQFGLGRSVAYTSDARAKWARNWLDWAKYQQFWTQVAQWSLRRIENSEYNTDINIEKGTGKLNVEALDNQGNFRNFLDLQALVVDPKGQKQTVRLEQTGPGRYEVNFPGREVGSYLVNLVSLKDGKVLSSQALGASVNYSPEFASADPNFNLLQRLADAGAGKILLPEENPFLLGRKRTFQPLD
ncbi:MAG: putative rane protein, partial [Verrucomicrobiales bacterium]|nr:putative rane protein [Verrucomicrobiales bacterium]